MGPEAKKSKPAFIFVVHFHQPVGQLREVLDRLFENSYGPLMETLLRYEPPIALHFSGPLLIYARDYYPDFLEMIKKAGDKGFLEFVGGTYSEAILPLIPAEDRVEQVRKYNDLFRRLVGDYALKGFWLPERFWDQMIPSIVSKFGYEYVFVDDQLLYLKGLKWSDSKYLWLTEDSGNAVKLFFIDTEVRYKLPWSPVPEVIQYVVKASELSERPYILWGSDAEKFGEWRPWDVTGRWLEEFLNEALAGEGFIMMRPRDYVTVAEVKGLTYLPHGSYDKMMEWSGGLIWNFLVKYSESNNMHKKLIYVRRKVANAESMSGFRLEDARDHIHLAECNDAYWHGLFGGTYVHHIRSENYRHLIMAENQADRLLKGRGVRKLDFDFDGDDEVVIEGEQLNAYVKPSDGGILFELDVRRAGHESNILNIMSRYPETYLSDLTYYTPDTYRRAAFREFLFRELGELNEWLSRGGGYSSGRILSPTRYRVVDLEEPGDVVMFSTLENRGLTKGLHLNGDSIAVTYYLSDLLNTYKLLVIEIPYSPYSLHKLRIEVGGGNVEVGSYVESDSFTLASESNRVDVRLSETAGLWSWKQVTLSRTEKGIKESLQGLITAIELKLTNMTKDYFRVTLSIS